MVTGYEISPTPSDGITSSTQPTSTASTPLVSDNEDSEGLTATPPTSTASSDLLISVDDGGSKTNKPFPCIFCINNDPPDFSFHSKLKRHLTRKHKNEPNVVKMIADTENVLFKKIKCEGAHLWNLNVIKKGSGKIIVSRAPGCKEADYTNYLPCGLCSAWITCSEHTAHENGCKIPGVKTDKKTVRDALRVTMTKEARDVIYAIRNDEIGTVIFILNGLGFFWCWNIS